MLIAFIVIILVVSLLITILVQMVPTALKLRGINLSRGLALTVDTAVPGSSAKVSVDALTDCVLQLPYLTEGGGACIMTICAPPFDRSSQHLALLPYGKGGTTRFPAGSQRLPAPQSFLAPPPQSLIYAPNHRHQDHHRYQ